MFERLKNMISGINLAWRYGDILRSFTTAWSRYPGLDNPDDLRTWVRPLLVDVASLTALTPTPIDDMIAFTAIRLVDNNNTWTAVHALALLARDGGFTDGVLIPRDQQIATTSELFETITSEMPENPTIILSAIGLLLYLLRQRWGADGRRQ
ncbi:MAG: hypothetical protein FWC43_04050 [Planctomycetaceae bacterium]|nr:hypothetical protein [Planctomycetaceae bacterium]